MPPARRSARAASHTAARVAAKPYTRANRQISPGTTVPRSSSASIARPANGKTSLRLTVKAPPSKLRQAISGSAIPPNAYADAPSESDATPQPPVSRTARATRNPRAVVEHDSDEDEGDDADDNDQDDEDGEGVDQDLLANEDSPEESDADEEEDGEDEDEEMEDELTSDHPPPPVIKLEQPLGKSKPNVTITAPSEGPMKSVEDKEMDDDEEEELSELDSNENEEEDEEESSNEDDNDEDGSRSATPDLSKLTRRQRGHFEESEAGLMALSNEAQKKKHLTAEEHAMRRAEMARRRKNLSEKRNEEEKVRLLESCHVCDTFH